MRVSAHQERHELLLGHLKADRHVDYDWYIGSHEWAQKRREYWALEGYCCRVEGCGVARDLQVHHRTYDRLGREEMADLVGLCVEHHREVHALQKSGAASLQEATDLVLAPGSG